MPSSRNAGSASPASKRRRLRSPESVPFELYQLAFEVEYQNKRLRSVLSQFRDNVRNPYGDPSTYSFEAVFTWLESRGLPVGPGAALYAAECRIETKHDFALFVLQVANGRFPVPFDDEVGAYVLRLRFLPPGSEMSAEEEELAPQDPAEKPKKVKEEAKPEEEEPIAPAGGLPDPSDLQALADEPEVIDLTQDIVDDQQAYATEGIRESIPQFSHRAWVACCKFFNHPVEYSANEHTYLVPGTELRLHPYQLYCVYWCLHHPCGALLADNMGLGKSFEVAGLVAVRAHLLQLWEDVERHPEAHYGAMAELGASDTCRLGEYHAGIQCPCQKDSDSRIIVSRLHGGPVVIVAGIASAVPVWFDVFYRYVLHSDANGNRPNTTVQFHVELGTTAPARPEMKAYQLTSPTIANLRAKADFSCLQDRRQAALDPIPYVLTARPGQYRHVILVNTNLLPGLQARFATNTPRVEGGRKLYPAIGLLPGWMFIDEFHRCKGGPNKDTLPIQTFLPPVQHHLAPDSTSPALFAVTATPIERSPADIYTLVKCIALVGEQVRSTKKLPDTASLDALTTHCNQLARAGDKADPEEVARYQTKLKHFLSRFTIIRGQQDRFDGHKIYLGEPAQRVDVAVPLPEEYRNSVETFESELRSEVDKKNREAREAWQARGAPGGLEPKKLTVSEYINGSSKGSAKVRFLRIVASFPAVADIPTSELSFESSAITEVLKKIHTPEDARATPYYERINDIVRGSPKIQKLRELVKELESDRSLHPYDGETTVHNMVLFSEVPAIMFILYLYLLKRFDGRVEPLLYRDKTAARYDDPKLERFRQWDKHQEMPRILLTTTGVLSASVSLTRADRCVLFHLPFMQRDATQCLGRVDRNGQKAKPQLYIFRTTGCMGDDAIWQRYQFRDSVKV